jgi:RNA polymerase sigma-70 factor, ECF subfamily
LLRYRSRFLINRHCRSFVAEWPPCGDLRISVSLKTKRIVDRMAKSALGTQLLHEVREKWRSQVTYASSTASVSPYTSEFSGALSVFRRSKRIVRSTSCGAASDLAHNLVKTRAEVLGREALEEMFAASRSKFVAIAYSILRNREDAEDAVQNAFLSAYRHLPSFEGRSALRTWLTRIVMNAALMIQRKRKSSTVTPVPENGNPHERDWIESIPASQPDPETAHAERETLDFIKEILGKMKPVLRQALTMTYFDELSGQEACALLGISSGTFKARLFRAKRQLLNQAQRALVAPVSGATPSSFFPDRSALQHVVARPSDRSSLEASYS